MSTRVRHACGFPDCSSRGAPPRAARHHRGRRQPHLGSAPLVSACPRVAARVTFARFLRLERHAGQVHGSADHLQGFRNLELDLGSGRQGILLAPLLLPPARSELRQPGRARGSQGCRRFLVRHGRRRHSGWMPSLTSTSARARTAKTCPKRTSILESCAATSTSNYPGRMLLAEANQWPEDAVAYFGDGDECHMASISR